MSTTLKPVKVVSFWLKGSVEKRSVVALELCLPETAVIGWTSCTSPPFNVSALRCWNRESADPDLGFSFFIWTCGTEPPPVKAQRSFQALQVVVFLLTGPCLGLFRDTKILFVVWSTSTDSCRRCAQTDARYFWEMRRLNVEWTLGRCDLKEISRLIEVTVVTSNEQLF